MRKNQNNEILDPMQTVCDNFHEWIQKEMKQYDPVMVQMLKIMKSIMPAKDYDGMMDTVYQSKDKIEPFKKHLLH